MTIEKAMKLKTKLEPRAQSKWFHLPKSNNKQKDMRQGFIVQAKTIYYQKKEYNITGQFYLIIQGKA